MRFKLPQKFCGSCGILRKLSVWKISYICLAIEENSSHPTLQHPKPSWHSRHGHKMQNKLFTLFSESVKINDTLRGKICQAMMKIMNFSRLFSIFFFPRLDSDKTHLFQDKKKIYLIYMKIFSKTRQIFQLNFILLCLFENSFILLLRKWENFYEKRRKILCMKKKL